MVGLYHSVGGILKKLFENKGLHDVTFASLYRKFRTYQGTIILLMFKIAATK